MDASSLLLFMVLLLFEVEEAQHIILNDRSLVLASWLLEPICFLAIGPFFASTFLITRAHMPHPHIHIQIFQYELQLLPTWHINTSCTEYPR